MLRMVNYMVDSYLELRRAADAADRLPAAGSWSTRAPIPAPGAPCSTRATRCACSRTPAKTSARRSPNGSTRSRNGRSRPTRRLQREREQLRLRSRDVLEHIERVLAHVRRLESSADTAVQMHFSEQNNRTNDIMRALTVLTAIFLPLNLVTGFFGMNFEGLPLIHSPTGFWIVFAIMLGARHRHERVLLAQALPEAKLSLDYRFSARDLALLTLLTVAWGLNWPVMKLGVTGFPPLSFRAISMWLGLPVLWAAASLAAGAVRDPPRRLGRARQALLHQHDRLAHRRDPGDPGALVGAGRDPRLHHADLLGAVGRRPVRRAAAAAPSRRHRCGGGRRRAAALARVRRPERPAAGRRSACCSRPRSGRSARSRCGARRSRRRRWRSSSG